jgi:hypothetical protein
MSGHSLTLLALLALAPAAGDGEPSRGASEEPSRRSRIGVANYYGVAAGVSRYPSFEQTLHLGLRQRAGRGSRMIGYSLTLSTGGADRYFAGYLASRHHVTAAFYDRPRPRLFATFGGGIALLARLPTTLEVEGRLGILFAQRPDRRVAGVVGGMLRVGWNVRFLEYVPMPQIGAFFGLVLR